MTVVASNAASADRTFPVRKYEDGTIAIVSNHTQITASRTAFRGDVWLSKMNGGKGGYLMETIENTRKLNATLVSIKAQLRPVGCDENNTKSALFNFTTNEYFNCTCKTGWGGKDCTLEKTCDASSPPTNGDVGTCTSSLAYGATCQPTCDSGYTVSGTSSCNAGTLTAATCSKVNYCDVLYEANSPTVPQLKAAEVNFPYHGHFGHDYAYHVSAVITTPQSGSYGSYEDLYMLGGTSACGSWFGGLYHGKPFIGTQCNWGGSTAVGISATTATSALALGTTYTIEWMYEPATNHAQIKVDGVHVVDSYPDPFLKVDSWSSYEYLSIGSGYHTQNSELWRGQIHTVSVQLCGNGMLYTHGADPGYPYTPLAMCEGDCDFNSDCKGDLICFQRDGVESVPGCDDSQYATDGYDYCVSPTFH